MHYSVRVPIEAVSEMRFTSDQQQVYQIQLLSLYP